MSYNPIFYNLLNRVENGHWWFVSRLNLILWCLEKKVHPFDNFLEIGCGTGFVLAGISRHFQTTTLHGTEFLEEGLVYARQRIPSANLQQLDALNMKDNLKYDAIGAFDVIEHIENDKLVLCNIFKALKKGGSLVISVPQHKWLWSETDVHARHARRYTKNELQKKVKQTGLDVIYTTSFTSLLLPLMMINRISLRFKKFDPMQEFLIPNYLNWFLCKIMNIEKIFIRLGIIFPFGGSLLLVARKPL